MIGLKDLVMSSGGLKKNEFYLVIKLFCFIYNQKKGMIITYGRVSVSGVEYWESLSSMGLRRLFVC